MAYVLSGVRKHQHSAMLGAVGFNGVLEATLVVKNAKLMTFAADVKVYTGDAVTPSFTITPADDGGKTKIFTNVDNLYTWLNSAFVGITDVTVKWPDVEVIAKPYNPPTDPVAYAIKRRDTVNKYKTDAAARLVTATSAVTAAEALGWHLPTAHPALQANYADRVANKQAVQGYVDAYTAEVTRLTGIIGA